MPTEKEVYAAHADQYERLILREDHENNIPAAVRKIKDFAGIDVVELGAGTGRLTRFLVREAASVAASDISHHMLSTARELLPTSQNPNLTICAADMRHTPLAANCADLVIAGWSFCYLAVWGEKAWRETLEPGLREIERLIRPGGAVVLLENYGTGFEEPQPPVHLDPYFLYLKNAGFQHSWIRTDYKFRDLEEALELSDFFFGADLSAKVKENAWEILPECTGVLWKNY
jgi:ubiquinone/menaquinone biosynthesis C-methylase UbiE